MVPYEVKQELKKYAGFPQVTANWNEKTKRWGFLSYDYKKGSSWVGWMLTASKAPN